MLSKFLSISMLSLLVSTSSFCKEKSYPQVNGIFGPVIGWPIIPIHVVLLSNGNVLSYGTDQAGNQGAQFIYDVWDPTLGTGDDSHLILPNTTQTDIFCSSQSLLPWGGVLMSGGDLTLDHRNYSNNKTTLFNPFNNNITSLTPMAYPRWYPSLVSLPDETRIVIGGWNRTSPDDPGSWIKVTERYIPNVGWSPLWGAWDDFAYSDTYPRAMVIPGGDVVIVSVWGTVYELSTQGNGYVFQPGGNTVPGSEALPTLSYSPGHVLSVRSNQEVVTLDFTVSPPSVNDTNPIDQDRFWSNATLLADGRVFVNGGSDIPGNISYQSTIWDPETGQWSPDATASIPRLYHSTSLLLPDGSVLTGGGGAPGAFTNLNAEIYYPSYLFDANGNLAARPFLDGLNDPTQGWYTVGNVIKGITGFPTTITKVTAVRTGSVTHSSNSDQRFIDNLPFFQEGPFFVAWLPSDNTVLVPGYYIIFIWDQNNVPSGKIVNILNSTDNHPKKASRNFE